MDRLAFLVVRPRVGRASQASRASLERPRARRFELGGQAEQQILAPVASVCVAAAWPVAIRITLIMNECS